MIQPLLEIKNLSKTFGSIQAVNKVSFSVDRATTVGLLGPNGAGKTTLLSMLTRHCEPDKDSSTSIKMFGYDPIKDELKIKYQLGIVPQEDNLDAELKVEQNLNIYARFYNLTGDLAKQRIHELLSFFDLNTKTDARIKELSGGMKRRLLIARALLNNPSMLILDEPTTGLDPQVRIHIWDRLHQLKQEGVTILLTTHYMDEAFRLCDKIIVMDEGKVVIQGNPHSLVRDNMERYVLELLQPELMNKFSEKAINQPGVRREEAARTVNFYAQDISLLHELEKDLVVGQYLLRESNLEDLFLKITGKALRE